MMQSVQVGMWDSHPPAEGHASPIAPCLQPHAPQRRSSHVSTSPAKRITFYKSGDSQFGGVKMAVHKRSFKCFDALLDDLSQKVPLPFGVRTVTTPRGTHTISHLEQLQDGGCYLCSDRRQAKPINMEVATRHPRAWSHHSRRPHRPDSNSATPPGHVPYRQRRLLLVKNTEPGVRRSVVLSRRVSRSLRAFLEEASDVMQFHVRKLYTVEGRKVDNVQSLMTCPNVLVCVGREAFSPLLVNYIRKSSDEKLPGLGTRTPGNGARSPPYGAQSRASENSEGPDSKKNMVNFGLETKKSIIHPRSDSSTRSARFSMSSEKSNGLSTVSQGQAAIMNDDIEKRVVVNKDGSLSVEMRVRFRLLSDETLQWSTRIKKSPSLINDTCSVGQGQPHYLQEESCSDPDCNSFEPDTADYSTQCAMEANSCPCCYQQEQHYDLWENPAHCHKQPVPPAHSTTDNHTILRHIHSSSSSSSRNSTRVVRCRARLTNHEDGSGHSQIVQEEMCVTEQRIVEQGVCTVSESCSRSEIVVSGDEIRPHSCKSCEEDVERPMSAISASSHVLQELKEDDDEELPPSASRCSGELSPAEDKPASDALAKQSVEAEETCQCHSTSGIEANERASTAKSTAGSCKSTKETGTDDMEEVNRVVSGLSASSRQSVCPICRGWKVKATFRCDSTVSSRSACKSPKPTTPNSAKDKDDSRSDVSTISHKSNQREVAAMSDGKCSTSMSKSEGCAADEIRASSATSGHRSNNSCKSGCEDNETDQNRSPSVISAKSCHSHCSAVSDLTLREEAEGGNVSERAVSAMSAKSGASARTTGSRKSMIKVTPPSTAEDEEENGVASVQSEKSNASANESRPTSAKSSKSQEEPRATSALSVKSNASAVVKRPASAKSTSSQNERSQKENAEEETRVATDLSSKSNKSRSASPMSIKSSKSSENESQNLEVKSNGKGSRPGSTLSVKSIKSDVSEKSEKVKDETRASSVFSVKSNATGKSTKLANGDNDSNIEVKSIASIKKNSRPASEISNKSAASERSLKNKVQNIDDNLRAESAISAKSRMTKESRPASAISIKSSKSHVSDKSTKSEKVEEEIRSASAMSSKSNASNKTEQRSISPRSNAEENEEERESSPVSNKSRKSIKLNCDGVVQNEGENQGERSTSAASSKSSVSVKSSKSVSSTKEKEQNGALSPSSGKTHSSVTSAKSKKSNQSGISTNVNEANDDKSERVTSPVSIKSGTSRKFHVITIKTPEVNINRPASSASAKTETTKGSSSSKEKKMVNGEKEEANESLVGDQVLKNGISIQTQELIPENGEQRGSSSLSVCSAKSGKSNKSKCSCGKKGAKDQEESEIAANTSSPKRDDYEDDSFASVSLVLPEDHDSESDCSISSRRNKSQTPPPKVSKSGENVEAVEQISPNNTNNIPTIETPGDKDKGAPGEKNRVHSSCSAISTPSVKSTKSKKSCSNCGKLKTKADTCDTASPVASEKSIATSRTGQLTAPDNRTSPALSSASAMSQKKLVKCEADKSSDESREQTSEDNEDAMVPRIKSKSPCRLSPKSSGSNKSKSNSTKAHDMHSVKSSQSKEGNVKSPSPQNVPRPASKGDTCSESVLSHSLSAADLLKEVNAKPPDSPRSKGSKSSNKSAKSQRSTKGAAQELTPSCLPNASPNEVVSDWLKSIPANVLALGDEDGLTEKCGEAMDEENGGGDEEEGKGEDEGAKAGEIESEEMEGPKTEEKVETFEIRPNGMVTESSLPKNWHPTSAVMKVLLSSSLGRCRSMPEVSPVYGRRLSTSAKELLDCLTQLQLIEPAGHQAYSVQKDQQPQFEDIISILQSLWLNDPRDNIADPKDPGGTEQVSPPRSSSGVGMSSGSGGSGKDNGNQEDDAKDEEVGVKTEEVSENPDSPKASDNPSSLDKNSKSPTDNDLDMHEVSSSESPPTVLRAPLTKRQSMDPDPVWVLHLLKKLEKQFMSHYVNAMADFKVKWDLEDNLILDRMIVDLKDEVSQRIEKSVEKEMKKIQSRAGKGVRVPRPPKGGSLLSQDSTMTDKRRQRLMVMKKLSVKTGDSVSDGELTADNSDQRSDDEYCPCEACMRKKMVARPLKTNPNAIEAPVQMEFDLFRILQHKKTPAPVVAKAEVVQEEAKRVVEEEARNLEVVQEEEEDDESKAEVETSEGLDTATTEESAEEGAEEGQCQCHCSEDDSDEETEESDKETVREKSLQQDIGAEEEEGSDEDTAEGGASEDAFTEERASEQEGVSVFCVTEGEDADVEDSGTEEKSEHEEIQTKTQNKSPVLMSRPKEDSTLLHQGTKTSVECQSGSMDDINNSPCANAKEVLKLASPGGTPHKRSRSPARVKRRKAKNSDSDMENI